MKLQEATQKILLGELVVFPTETVYGIGALAWNEQAVRRIFEVKGRPSKNPLILHIAEKDQLRELVEEISPSAQKLIDHFWPGPLTICFKKSERVSDLITGGLGTVCIRMPSHETAHELLKLVGQPVAAPSANISGKPSTTTYEDARRQLQEKNVHFLDGGKSPLGVESTVIDCSSETVRLFRPGVISREELESVLSQTIEDASQPASDQVFSPGQILEHYAPTGNLLVIQGTPERRASWKLNQQFDPQKRYAFGVIGLAENTPGLVYMVSPEEHDLNTYATELYSFLNWCDRQQADEIILELPQTEHPIMEAVKNRLEKASKGNILMV